MSVDWIRASVAEETAPGLHVHNIEGMSSLSKPRSQDNSCSLLCNAERLDQQLRAVRCLHMLMLYKLSLLFLYGLPDISRSYDWKLS